MLQLACLSSTTGWQNKKKTSIGVRKTHAVPLVSFLDFPDSHKFGGLSILSDVSDLDDSDPRLLSMEKFAKTALTLFFPFRNPSKDLILNGNHLSKFQNTFSSGALDKYEHYFVNAQESHDSFNCGRPDDILESITSIPKCAHNPNTSDSNELLMEMDKDYVDNMDIIVPPDSLNFHDTNNKLMIHTSVIIESGGHRCGNSLINQPTPANHSAIAVGDLVE